MKKLLALTLITAFLLSLTACGNQAAVTGDDDPDSLLEVLNPRGDDEFGDFGYWDSWSIQREAPDFNNLTIVPDAASGESLEIPSMWVTELGAYFVETVTTAMGTSIGGVKDDYESSTLLHIIDSATGNEMVLCPLLTCSHNSEDCGAYLPDEPFDPDEFQGGWGMTSMVMRGGFGGGSNYLFIDDGFIYALNSGRTFYRFNLDGSGRTEYMILPDKYEFSWGRNWLMNGKLYMMTNFMISTDDFNIASVPALIEVDYINKTVNEIWAGEENLFAEVLGLWEGKLFLMQTLYPDVNWDDSNEIQYFLDNQEIEIFSFNPINGQRTEILKDTSYGFSTSIWSNHGAKEHIFHSRRDEVLGMINVVTGERTILVENFSGDSVYTGDTRDGRLFISRDTGSADWDLPWIYYDRELFFYEYATGEIVEITLRTRQNVGLNPPMDILFEEDGYFYVMVEQVLEEQTNHGHTWHQATGTLLGRIPAADYWVSNADAVEELDWYDEQEWWTMLGEKQGWGIGGRVSVSERLVEQIIE